MNLEILTRDDIVNLKTELLDEIRKMIEPRNESREWLKNAEVRKILNCSPGTLQNLRINGILPFSKIGGTIYYAYSDVMEVLKLNKRKVA